MAIITISRGSLSGGEALAQELHQRLGHRIISREVIIEQAARDYGVDETKLAENLDRPPSVWQRLTEHREGFLLAVQAALFSMVEEGDAVYHGQAGHFLLKGAPHLLRLRLIAPMAARIQAAMARRGLSREQAETYIAEVDRQRARWVQTMYGEDCSDPRLYDFVVNLEQVSVAHAAEVVCGMARQPEFVPTAHSRTKLRDLALSARARATLLLDAKVPQSAVVAESRDGVLHLWGRDYLHHHRDAVLAALSRVPGVGEIVVEGDRGRESPISGAQSGAVAREIMLPIAAYPSVRPSTTIREALVALGSSTVKLHDGHLIPPRYLLVISETGELLGLLTRRDLLRGLSPHLAILEQTRQEVSRIVPFAAAASSLPFSWVSFFSPSAVERSKEPVRAVMNPIRGVVDAEADLSSVVSTMLSKQIDLVPVIDGGRVQGVIVMTDVFDRVAEYVLEHGGSPQG